MTTKTIIIFILLQLLNVILQTTRSILTIKANKIIASIASAVAYGVYAVVTVVMVSGFELWLVVAVTATTNLIGTYFSKWLLEKFHKDNLWEIIAITTQQNASTLKPQLEQQNILSYYINLENGKSILHIYSKNQKDSILIKTLLDKTQCQYIVQQQDVRL